jgi:hypothetical protein
MRRKAENNEKRRNFWNKLDAYLEFIDSMAESLLLEFRKQYEKYSTLDDIEEKELFCFKFRWRGGIVANNKLIFLLCEFLFNPPKLPGYYMNIDNDEKIEKINTYINRVTKMTQNLCVLPPPPDEVWEWLKGKPIEQVLNIS